MRGVHERTRKLKTFVTKNVDISTNTGTIGNLVEGKHCVKVYQEGRKS